MKMAIDLAGFTPGEADELRRAINAWKSKGSIEKMGLRLKEGVLENGLPPEFVERLFMQIQGFAEYGFPESHAASFALLAMRPSCLNRHIPEEFNAALINSQPMGFYSSHTLIEEAKRNGVAILPVDINRSDWDCEIVYGDDQLGSFNQETSADPEKTAGHSRGASSRAWNERRSGARFDSNAQGVLFSRIDGFSLANALKSAGVVEFGDGRGIFVLRARSAPGALGDFVLSRADETFDVPEASGRRFAR